MSRDFLTNLAAQALDVAGVVRPRLPSIFEPAPAVNTPEPLSVTRTTQPIMPASEVAAPTAPAEWRRTNPAPSSSAALPTHTAIAPSAPPPPTVPSSIRPRTDGPPPTTADAKHINLATPSEVVERQIPANAEPRARVDADRTVDGAAAPSAATPLHLGPSGRDQPTTPSFVQLAPESVFSVSAADAALSPVARRDEARSAPEVPPAAIVVPQALVPPPRRPAEHIDEQAARALPAPERPAIVTSTRVRQFSDATPSPTPASVAASTIHVTIGRIEVRATAPSPTSARQREKPVTDLDDYLKQRTHGGGR